MSDSGQSVVLQGSSSDIRSSVEKEKSVWNQSCTHVRTQPPDVVEDVYDVGSDAWMTVIATWMIQFCTYGYVSAFGIYQDYYTRSFLKEESPSNISWIGSFQLFMQYAPGIIVGHVFDLGYFRHLIILGTLMQVTSMFMLSFARAQHFYEVFLTQALGMGLGQALLFLPSLSILGQHFRRRRALAIGIATSGASVGGIVWPILLNQLSRFTSFSNAIRATAGLTALLLILSNLIVKTKPPQLNTSPKSSICSILRDSPYVISIVSAFCINLGLFFPIFYLQLYAVNKGVPESLAFYVIAILNSGSVLGRLLPNFFADRFGAYNMLLPCLFISSAMVFVMLSITNLTGVVIFGLLYGFWSGSYVSLIPTLLAQLSTSPGEHGTRMGIAFSIVGISLLVGTPIEGALLHRDGKLGHFSWNNSVIFCGVIVLFGAICMSMSRYRYIILGRAGTKGWKV